ncbi:hypothetical protein O2N63_16715 [Aliiroseovarius sp. KMU-50]|uniref:Uncharacterized protein n=1 Tax=Aliiroseovarius salicola TaxID=3009082 RepID=A0ABT4W5S6_9RHOB|nr:hypothetical protein [Aliiroseovarius sp. KMU-50]MDA5095734.1 hypothetical protein [Aliiroseovarius sp. KMU-50]
MLKPFFETSDQLQLEFQSTAVFIVVGALAEIKGREEERIEQCSCFLFTTNHLPTWIEPGDRRFYVVEKDHDGHAAGPESEAFQELVSRLRQELEHPEQLAALYAALMPHEAPESFNAKSLNVERDGTAVMKRIQEASQQVQRGLLDECCGEGHAVLAMTGWKWSDSARVCAM